MEKGVDLGSGKFRYMMKTESTEFAETMMGAETEIKFTRILILFWEGVCDVYVQAQLTDPHHLQ